MEKFSFLAVSEQLDLVKEEGITFEDKQLTWDEAADVREVVDALENQRIVHYLKLEGNTLGVNAAEAIGNALQRHPEFRKALWKNLFTRRLKTEIPQALKHLGNGLIVANAHLNVLDLSDNALGPNGMVGLEELLRSPVCYSLQQLYLNNCGLGIGGGRMLSKAILDCLEKSTAAGTPLRLKTFVAGRNRLENDGAKAIAHMFGTLRTLEEIVMPQNSIYHVGISALADGFKRNPNLRVINLNDNTVTYKGASSLADALRETVNLQEINLGDCLLKNKGALFIADFLDLEHKLLEIVDLSFNEISITGGIEIATALQNKPHLQRLNLGGNRFGEEGIEEIKEIMAKNPNPNALVEFDEDEFADESDNEEVDEDDEEREENEDSGSGESDDEEDYDEHYAEDEEDEFELEHRNMLNLSNYKVPVGATINASFGQNSTISTDDSEYGKEKATTTAETFCLTRHPCSLQMFDSLQEDDKLKAMLNIINQFSDDDHILLLIFTTLKCAHLSKISPAALEIAMDLYEESFEYAAKHDLEKRVLEYYLIQLGLLECEEDFEPLYDSKSCRYALRETLNKKSIKSDIIKNGIEAFLSKLDV